jgi:hypothetical protein
MESLGEQIGTGGAGHGVDVYGDTAVTISTLVNGFERGVALSVDATQTVDIKNKLTIQGVEVVVGGSGGNALLLDQTVPQIVANGGPDFQGGLFTPTISDDGTGLTIKSNSANSSGYGLDIENNSGGIFINSNGTGDSGSMVINLVSSDEGNAFLRVNYSSGGALEIDNNGNTIIGSGNGEQLVLQPQGKPVGFQGSGAMYYDDEAGATFLADQNLYWTQFTASNTLIINASNQSSFFAQGNLVDGWIKIEKWQHSAKFTFACHISAGGTAQIDVPFLAGLFQVQSGSTYWSVPISRGTDTNANFCVDVGGVVNINLGIEGTIMAVGSYELPYTNLTF